MRLVSGSILALSVLLFSACGTFKGAGEFKTGADYTAPEGHNSGDPSSSDESAHSNTNDESKLEALPFELEWPVNAVRITQHFQPPGNPHHKGLDLGGARGMAIHSAHEGRVIYAGRKFHGYGNMVMIEYDNQWATLYAHLQRIKIKRGAKVHPGTLIGTMGRTGHATGVHLHFELMHDKLPIDPLLYLQPNQLVGAHSR